MAKVKNKSYALTLDLGKDSSKAIGMDTNDILNPASLKKVIFKTKQYDLKDGDIDVQGDSYKVVYNNESYIIGEQGTKRSYITSKTSALHQICAYTAITRYLEPNTTDNEVNIVLACPVSVLKTDEAKEKYKELIRGNGIINIEVNDMSYGFTINDITLKAESSGIIYLEPDLFKNQKVLVVDFGGLNMTVTLFTDKVCANPDTDRFLEEHGSVALYNIASEKLTAYRDGNFVDAKDAELALNRGYLLDYGKKDLKSIEVLENAKQKYFNKACDLIAQHGIQFRDLDKIIFIGGTSNYLKDQISQLGNGFITDNSQWSSIEGLFKIATKKYVK